MTTLFRRVTIDCNHELQVEIRLVCLTYLTMLAPKDLKKGIKAKSSQLGFILAGVTTPEPPPHYSTFESWLAQGHHGTMDYLASDRSRARRANPYEILP